MGKNKSKVTSEEIIGIIALIVGANYFLSYRWLYGMLKAWGIENFSIISMEDLTFTFASLNMIVFVLSLMGFVGVFIMGFLSSKNSNVRKKLLEIPKKLKEWYTKKSFLLKSLIICVFGVLLVTCIVLLKSILHFSNSVFIIIYFILLILPSALHIFIKGKKNYILGIHFFLIFCWANFFINSILEKASSNNSKSEMVLKFEYKDEIIVTSDSLFFLFHGYKYLILKDKYGKIKLFDSKNVGKIEYEKVETGEDSK